MEADANALLTAILAKKLLALHPRCLQCNRSLIGVPIKRHAGDCQAVFDQECLRALINNKSKCPDSRCETPLAWSESTGLFCSTMKEKEVEILTIPSSDPVLEHEITQVLDCLPSNLKETLLSPEGLPLETYLKAQQAKSTN